MRWYRSAKVLLVAVPGFFLLLSVWGYFIYQRANELPPSNIPIPVMPSPNAYDFYVKAGNAVVSGDEIINSVATKTTHKYKWAEKANFVAANASALKTFRQGMQYSYQPIPARSFNDDFPEYKKFRDLARLVVLKGQVAAQQKDWKTATNSYVDAMYLGHEIPRGSPLLGYWVGLACESIGQRPAWEAAKKVNAADARAAAKRLEAMEAKRFPLADTLQEEKWCTQAILREVFRHQSSGQAISTITGYAFAGNGAGTGLQMLQGLYWNFQLQRYGKRQILENNATYMDGLSAQVKLPYASRPPAPALPPDMLSQILLPVYNKVHIKDTDSRNQNALLMTVFALRGYQAEKGTYPASLDELVQTKILKRLPDDVFALAGTFQYRRLSADNYLLYSVGPDGKDDNGEPINNPNRDGSQKRWAEEGTKGDFVVGVNTY